MEKPLLRTLALNWPKLIFIAILLLAVFTRFYDLEARVMSHDENSHVYFSWQLYRGLNYVHDPVTHGPFQFHMVALSYFLFGDNDLTARIPSAVFGIAAVAFLWAYRRYLGTTGTLIAAGLFVISPFLLYYDRYVRNESFIVLFGVVMLWAIVDALFHPPVIVHLMLWIPVTIILCLAMLRPFKATMIALQYANQAREGRSD